MIESIQTLAPQTAAWLNSAALTKVFATLSAGGFEARAVGGAVRNSLSGRPITDIDLATPAKPDQVMRLMRDANIAVYPTGIDHGTVTVTIDGHAFEVTTLRRDVATDGRRAVVAFTDNWREDSERRDFTINALYLDQHFRIHDFHGGLDDLTNGRVRFIGDARARIREDYLRILRFFRFTAEYGRGVADGEALAACKDLRAGIAQLSSERVGAELLKFMAAPQPSALCQIMDDTGISDLIFGTKTYSSRLAKLEEIEKAHALQADPLLRLAVLALAEGDNGGVLTSRLRLSNEHSTALYSAQRGVDAAFLDPQQCKSTLYRCGTSAFQKAALAAWARSDDKANDATRSQILALSANWIAPQMPFSGADVLALGVTPGPAVGRILTGFEQWWIAEDFPANELRNRRKLRDIAAANSQIS